MANQVPEPVKRGAPSRYLEKEQAVRHMIHAATRLVAAREDPFAIHLLVHSADKLLIDLSKKLEKPLAFDWDKYLRDDRRKEFYQMYREPYNFFKHADRDFDATLPIHNIAQINILMLGYCVFNYNTLFGKLTDHMRFVYYMITCTFPGAFVEDVTANAQMKAAIDNVSEVTLETFFTTVLEQPDRFFPSFSKEAAEDLADTDKLYARTIGSFHAKKTE